MIYKALHMQLNSGSPEGNNFCSTNGTCRVTLVTNPIISHEQRKYGIGITTIGPISEEIYG